MKKYPTQEELKNHYLYNDGNLISKKTNKSIGYIDKAGYWSTTLYKKYFSVHRLIFLFHHGYVPKTLDHIDRNKSNNKIENLRECTYQQNSFNRLPSKKNTSGYRNVTKNSNNKWQVGLTLKGQYHYFGSFNDIELADLVAQEARDKYHKQFKCNGVSK
jgi:hypothetical protein